MPNRFATLCVLAAIAFLPALAHAEDPANTISGTTLDPLSVHRALVSRDFGAWRIFGGANLAYTKINSSGSRTDEGGDAFVSSWGIIGAEKRLSDRLAFALRGRVTAEDPSFGDDGYREFFQVSSDSNGVRLFDREGAHDQIEELAAMVSARVNGNVGFSLYAAAAGDPAFGTTPFAQRVTSADLAHAPYSEELLEPFRRSTEVATFAVDLWKVRAEVSRFGSPEPARSRTGLDLQSPDSWSGRITFAPNDFLTLQVSQAQLPSDRTARNASITLGRWSEERAIAVSLIGGDVEGTDGETRNAVSGEVSAKYGRATYALRVERAERDSADIPEDVRAVVGDSFSARGTSLGYVYDAVRVRGMRFGLGASLLYPQGVKKLEPLYGHKPQMYFVFARFRTGE